MSESQLPVTVVVSRRPKPGHEQDLVDWANGISEVAETFSGHLGRQVYPPSLPDRSDLVIAFSFASAAELRAWETSPQRAEWLKKADAIAEGPQHTVGLTGFESIFSPSVGVTKSPPPRWKTGVIIGLALFPLSLLLNWLVMPHLSSWNVVLRVALSTLIIVPYMIYFAVPWLTKSLRGWLHPKA